MTDSHLACCHQALKDKLVTKTDQFCTAQRQIENRAAIAKAIAFLIT